MGKLAGSAQHKHSHGRQSIPFISKNKIYFPVIMLPMCHLGDIGEIARDVERGNKMRGQNTAMRVTNEFSIIEDLN